MQHPQRLKLGLLVLLLAPVLAMAADDGPAFTIAKDIPFVEDHHELQTLDIYYKQGKKLPVVIYVHGGGWAFGDKQDLNAKPEYLLSADIALVSVNYRLRWDFSVFNQLEDIASAIYWVKRNGDAYGLDSNRIVLMGHAAGAHLAALTVTNPGILKAVELSATDIIAVVAIDTGSYDIPNVMNSANFIEQRQHRLIFGADERTWLQYSPIYHVTEERALPGFAILYAPDKEPDNWQAQEFAARLKDKGVETILIPANGVDGDSIDESFGAADDIPSKAAMAFVRAKL